MKIKQLFNYRPGGKDIILNDGETKVKSMGIRKGPRGIVSLVRGKGVMIIWDKDEADTHIEDSETDLLNKLKEVIG